MDYIDGSSDGRRYALGSNYYPTEIERYDAVCTQDKVNKRFNDERYNQLQGLEISEKQLQEESGVMQILTKQKDWMVHVNVALKETHIFRVWWRPTLAFKLGCEEYVDRQAAIESLEKVDSTQAINTSGYSFFMPILYGLMVPLLSWVLSVLAEGNQKS